MSSRGSRPRRTRILFFPDRRACACGSIRAAIGCSMGRPSITTRACSVAGSCSRTRTPRRRAVAELHLAFRKPMSTSTETIEQLASREYKYGFETTLETDSFPPGLDEQVVRRLSAIKEEPEWLLEFRLKSYRAWLEMKEPVWHNLKTV